jgi:hypothetical protein
MKNNPLLFLGVLFTAVFLVSCSSDSCSDAKLVKRIVDVTANGTSRVNLFTYSGAKIVRIDQEDNFLEFTYSGDLITKTVAVDESAQTQTTVEYTYLNNNIIKMVSSENYVMYFTHNTDGTVSYEKKTTDGFNNEVLVFHGVLYFENGNLVKDEKVFDDADLNVVRKEKSDYFYDAKINPLCNILGFDKLLNYRDAVSKNNTVSCLNSYSETYISTNQSVSTIRQTTSGILYNGNGFPKERISESPVIMIGAVLPNYTKSLFYY